MKYKILGQGSYGCVLHPALGFNNNKKYVSKITKTKKRKTNELKISKKLSRFKNASNHFCLIIDSKKIKYSQTPKYLRDEKFLHEPHTCRIFEVEKENRKTQEYISNLMPFCGSELVLNESLNFLKDHNIFLKFILHLLNALKMAKDEKILFGDIKLSNILLNENKMPIIIDFDDSQVISSKMSGLLKNINNVVTTADYTSPELILLKFVIAILEIESNTKKEENMKKKNFSSLDIDNFIKLKLEENIDDMCYELNSEYNKLNKRKIIIYYKSLLNNNGSKKLLNNLDKIIYKSDIYALGRVFQDINNYLKSKNKKINYLIDNMLLLDHNKRFSIEKCIEVCST